jgi:hypothetical protein
MGVGRHPGARTETLDGVSQGLILRPSPVGHAAEPVSGIIGSADDAGLEAGDAACMDGAAVPAGLPRHPGSTPCPVSREGLAEAGAASCQETEGPVLEARGGRSIASQSLMRMDQEVLRHTWHVFAHCLRPGPESAASTKSAQAVASGLEAAGRPLLLDEDVLPHPLQSQRWEPPALCPFLMKEEEPHRGHDLGVAPSACLPGSRAAVAFVAQMSSRFSPRESPSISWSMMSSIPSPSLRC